MIRTEERFWSSVYVSEFGGCWPWRKMRPDGYAQFWDGVKERLVYVHRYAYEQVHGPVPVGLQVDHVCRNRACCNPAHLEAVTAVENTRRSDVGKKLLSRTMCKSGHAFDDGHRRKNAGPRLCRACAVIYRARHAAKKTGES